MVDQNAVNALDPILLRRIYTTLAGIDPGANPQFFANILQTAFNAGVIPVVPINNRHIGFVVPLDVYPRGWWGGGVVDLPSGQIQTNISSITADTNIPNTYSVNDITITLPAGKVIYVTGLGCSGAGATTTKGWTSIRLYDNTNTVSAMEHYCIGGLSSDGTAGDNPAYWSIPVKYTNPSSTVAATLYVQSRTNVTGTLSGNVSISGWIE
jgi:hypothetical protein